MADFADLQTLAAEARAKHDGPTATLYVIQPQDDYDTSSLNRVGGPPPAAPSWPEYDDAPMVHVLTVDLADAPALQEDALEGVRAVSLFLSDAWDNKAYEPDTEETAVLLLTDADLAAGEPDEVPAELADAPASFTLAPLEVPALLFDDDARYELSDDDPVSRLWLALMSVPGYVGGEPLWIQYPEHEGAFVAQFNENLVEVNLGDAGEMYVFADTAFWQCS